MPTIHDQLAWEDRMIAHGVVRYRSQQDKAAEGSRAHETSAGSALLRAYVLQISERIELYLAGKHPEGRRRNKYAKLLNTINPDKAAMFALKSIIATLYRPATVQAVLITIGMSIEDELRFSKFETEYSEYYETLVRNWETRGTTHYGHRRNVLSTKSRDKGMQWEDWTKETRLGIGSLVVSLLMEVCDLCEITYVSTGRGRQDAIIGPTQACIDWVMQHNAGAEIGNPDKMPCIVPPADWLDVHEGGFYGPMMRKRTPLVKGMGQAGRRALLEAAEMPGVLNAANALQRTGWAVNARVLETLREVWHKNLGIGMPRSQPYEIPPCPLGDEVKPSDLAEDSPERQAFDEWKAAARDIHAMEGERVSQNFGVSRVIRMAVEMQERAPFYYVYQCDFRGRFYTATAGLTPQGTDHGKALLTFAEGKPLGERGLYWLKVHGANKYGTDKLAYDDRVAWIEERSADWLRAAEDPISNREVWQDADKPYQFLAFCFEYAGAQQQGAAFVSHLPLARDGSCNGLQHFSAMLRDATGGAAVNLTPGDKPADIYQEVADVCTRKLHGLRSMNTPEHGGAANWLAAFDQVWGEERMFRKLPKKPVMTLPYGSTMAACTDTIFRWTVDNAPDFFEKNTAFRHAIYLSPKLWSAISEVVVAARAAMDWIQSCTAVLSKAGHPIEYVTPLGFPVRQASRHYETRQINTQIGGRLRLRIAEDTEKLDSRKQRQGSSPNFVHSIDATHMMMCVNASVAAGIDSFAMIHDDFGVHGCDAEVFDRIIREEFVKLHSDDLLQSFKDQHEQAFGVDLPDLPAKGVLDISDVLRSPFFFG